MKHLPAYEKQLNAEFSKIYQQLADLKNNRQQYLDSKQIYRIYNTFLNYLNELSIIRKDEEIKGMKLELPNLNDSLVDDIWQLISLCFMTCGLTKFAPATYSSLSTVYKLLIHLKDGKLYTIEDLKPIESRLDEIKSIIDSYNYQDDYEYEDSNNDNSQKNEQINYIRKKFIKCENLLHELIDNIEDLPDQVKDIYNKLLTLRKNLINLVIDNNESGMINKYEGELKEIESLRDSLGNFDCNEHGQSILNGLLDDCNNLIKDINISKGKSFEELFSKITIDDGEDKDNTSSEFGDDGDNSSDEQLKLNAATINEFKVLYNQLVSIKFSLENLLITRRWTLRETDLYNYQNEMKSIENKRLEILSRCSQSLKDNLKFKNIQLLLLYLLRRCYSLIYKLLESSEPVSESLQPIHNQLSTVRRCLLDIKRIDGLNNLRELYPFQFKLASLDNLRNDGKFIINNQIPEGQGTLNALLAECFDIIHELKIELEAKEEQAELQNSSHHVETDDEDINSDDEVELKRNRYVSFNEADYNQASETESLQIDDDEDEEIDDGLGYEANDYY